MTILTQGFPGIARQLLIIACLTIFILTGASARAEEDEPAAASFPGLNEVVPQSTAIAAKLALAEAQLNQADSLEPVYSGLDRLAETLNNLEAQYTGWEDAANWRMNSLLSAESKYNDLYEQIQKPLDIINAHLKTVVDMDADWERQKTYLRDWLRALKQQKAKVPVDVFQKTEQGIDALLKRIDKISGTLIMAQQKYSAAAKTIDSRLNLIAKTLDTLRLDALHQSTYTLLETDFYAQFDRDLFSKFRDNIGPTIRLPEGFLKRHNLVIAFQLISTLVISGLLFYRRKQTKPITREWKFLFHRPIAGGVFISLVVISFFSGTLYSNMPPTWRWLMMVTVTLSAIRLLTAIYESPLGRRILRILGALYIVTESMLIIGLPVPLLQLYYVAICAAACPLCWLLARRHQQHVGNLDFPATAMYVTSLIALIGLTSSFFGFVFLTANLIDAALTTLIMVLIVQMALRLVDGGIIAFMRLHWVRDRKLILHLGLRQATQRMKTLAHIIILAQAACSLLVAWKLFDNSRQAREAFLQLEYSLGEFSLSVEMVIMVAIVLYLTTLLSWLLQAFLDTQIMVPRKMDVGIRASMKRLTQYALYTIGFLVAISMAGIELERFTILAGAFGVGIGFGLQNIVNNFVSGLILLFERPVKVGDTINIDDQWGTITKIGLRSTVFETLDRAEIIVPNSDLISQKVTNWTFTTNISRIVLTIGVAYGSPLDKVLEILHRVANEHADILKDPEASAIFTGFGDSSLDFELRVWTADINKRLKIKSELGQAIDHYFREEGITIPFPQRDLHLRSIESNLQGVLTNSGHPRSD